MTHVDLSEESSAAGGSKNFGGYLATPMAAARFPPS
jgi:hypothetical protein